MPLVMTNFALADMMGVGTSAPISIALGRKEEETANNSFSCPLHAAAVKTGVPEAALVVCAMDKVCMTGFKHIRYTPTTSVAEGAGCCDDRLRFDATKK